MTIPLLCRRKRGGRVVFTLSQRIKKLFIPARSVRRIASHVVANSWHTVHWPLSLLLLSGLFCILGTSKGLLTVLFFSLTPPPPQGQSYFVDSTFFFIYITPSIYLWIFLYLWIYLNYAKNFAKNMAYKKIVVTLFLLTKMTLFLIEVNSEDDPQKWYHMNCNYIVYYIKIIWECLSCALSSTSWVLLFQMSRALKYIHSADVIHRDLVGSGRGGGGVLVGRDYFFQKVIIYHILHRI